MGAARDRNKTDLEESEGEMEYVCNLWQLSVRTFRPIGMPQSGKKELTSKHLMVLHFWRKQELWLGCSRTDRTCVGSVVATKGCVAALQRRVLSVTRRIGLSENGPTSLSKFNG